MVRPVINRAIKNFKLEDKWNFNLEFISDGKCADDIRLIHTGSKRYYNHHPNQSVCCKDKNADCNTFCDNFEFKSRLADVFVGMPCDYVYGGILELSREFNAADLRRPFIVEGTGLPIITAGHRGQSVRYKDGMQQYRPFKNVMRVGPTVANMIRPIELLVKKFGWQYFTIIGYG